MKKNCIKTASQGKGETFFDDPLRMRMSSIFRPNYHIKLARFTFIFFRGLGRLKPAIRWWKTSKKISCLATIYIYIYNIYTYIYTFIYIWMMYIYYIYDICLCLERERERVSRFWPASGSTEVRSVGTLDFFLRWLLSAPSSSTHVLFPRGGYPTSLPKNGFKRKGNLLNWMYGTGPQKMICGLAYLVLISVAKMLAIEVTGAHCLVVSVCI